jgi:hypothetical protein
VWPHGSNTNSDFRNLQTIKFLRSSVFSGDLVMFDAAGGFCFYLFIKCDSISEYAKPKELSFLNFVNEKNINIIVLSDAMVEDKYFIDDKSFQFFVSSPAISGFELLLARSADLPYQIFVRKGLAIRN